VLSPEVLPYVLGMRAYPGLIGPALFRGVLRSRSIDLAERLSEVGEEGLELYWSFPAL